MVTTGQPYSSATKTEILDLVSGKTCGDLADFPLEIYSGKGANINEIPIACGGYDGYSSGYFKTCWKFTENVWQTFATMNVGRGSTAGITYNNKFHIFGGAKVP